MMEDLRILPSPNCFPPLKLPPLEPWNGRDVQKQSYTCKLSHKAPPIKTLKWDGCSKKNHTKFNLKLPNGGAPPIGTLECEALPRINVMQKQFSVVYFFGWGEMF